MKIAYLTRNQVIRAVNYAADPQRSEMLGMCCWFDVSNKVAKWRSFYNIIPTFLLSIGGRANSEYFWTRDEEGREQRLLMLAFMLTWMEDE